MAVDWLLSAGTKKHRKRISSRMFESFASSEKSRIPKAWPGTKLRSSRRKCLGLSHLKNRISERETKQLRPLQLRSTRSARDRRPHRLPVMAARKTENESRMRPRAIHRNRPGKKAPSRQNSARGLLMAPRKAKSRRMAGEKSRRRTENGSMNLQE